MTRYFLAALVMVGVGISGCATVPAVVPQTLLDARSALAAAKQANADVMAAGAFEEAQRRLKQAENTFVSNQDIAKVEDASFEARSYAQIAEAYAHVKLAEQEWQNVRTAVLQQQSMLTALTDKQGVLAGTVQQLPPNQKITLLAEAQADAAHQPVPEPVQTEHLEKIAARLRQIPGVKVVTEERGVVACITGNKLFDQDSSKLQSDAHVLLEKMAGVLSSSETEAIRIEGHTDNTGDVLMNNTLSQARAESVLNYFNQKSVALDRMKAIGMGSNRPIAPNTTLRGQQANRRIEIVITTKSGS